MANQPNTMNDKYCYHDETDELRAKRREMETARADFDDTVDELNTRFGMRHAATRVANGISNQSRAAANAVACGASRTFEACRTHPISTFAVGAGIAWLVLDRRHSPIHNGSLGELKDKAVHAGSAARERVESTAERVKEVATDTRDRAEERVRTAGARLRDRGRRSATTVIDQASEHPIVLGAAVAGIGMLTGLLLSRRDGQQGAPSRDADETGDF
jgi:ElaB/YqjD/DUF883 family membrane-anchored ribosome-binding protein